MKATLLCLSHHKIWPSYYVHENWILRGFPKPTLPTPRPPPILEKHTPPKSMFALSDPIVETRGNLAAFIRSETKVNQSQGSPSWLPTLRASQSLNLRKCWRNGWKWQLQLQTVESWSNWHEFKVSGGRWESWCQQDTTRPSTSHTIPPWKLTGCPKLISIPTQTRLRLSMWQGCRKYHSRFFPPVHLEQVLSFWENQTRTSAKITTQTSLRNYYFAALMSPPMTSQDVTPSLGKCHPPPTNVTPSTCHPPLVCHHPLMCHITPPPVWCGAWWWWQRSTLAFGAKYPDILFLLETLSLTQEKENLQSIKNPKFKTKLTLIMRVRNDPIRWRHAVT